jgi:hypothetical protein
MTALQKRLVLAKKIATSKKSEVPDKSTEERTKIYLMKYAYEDMLKSYTHSPFLRFFKASWSNGTHVRVQSFLLKAATLADQYEVEYFTFVKAQFYWFDKWFRRAPYVYELSGQSGKFPASKRLVEYLALDRAGKINNEISSPVVPQRKRAVDPNKLDKANLKTLNDLCKAYRLTEEEALTKFAPAGLFDLEWLKKRKQEKRG